MITVAMDVMLMVTDGVDGNDSWKTTAVKTAWYLANDDMTWT